MDEQDVGGCRRAESPGSAPPRGGAGGAPGWFLSTVAAGALLAATVGPAAAQGFSINEHGSCSMGRGGAAVAEPCDDGSAMLFNPAGLTAVDGVTVSAGGTLVSAFGDFTADATGNEFDLQNDPIPVPHGYAAFGLSDRLSAGLGVFVPYGLETEWPSTRESGFAGRFVGYNSSLQSIYVQPTVAYDLTEWLSVGAGLDVVLSQVELNQRLDLSRQFVSEDVTFGQLGIPFQTDFADATLDGDMSTGIGGNFGVQIRATDAVTLGARYMTQVSVDYEGTATFEQVPTGLTLPTAITIGGQTVPAGTPVDQLVAPQFQPGGPLATQGVETEITMPDQLVAGIAVRPLETLLIEADWQWMNWADFDRIPIRLENQEETDVRIEDYTNTNAIRLGAEYEATPDVTLRGGYIYHDAAAPEKTVTPLLPEARRNEFTAGLGFRLSPQVTVDAAYQYILQDDRRGRVRDAPPGQEPTAALNSGLYSFGAHLFGATFTLHF